MILMAGKMANKFLCFVFLIASYVMCAQDKSDREVFPKMDERAILKPKIITQIDSFCAGANPKGDIMPFCIWLNKNSISVEGRKLYEFRFGCYGQEGVYLYKEGDDVYSAKVDSNKILHTFKLFNFSNLYQPDTIQTIKYSTSALNKYYQIIENIRVEENDTVICYKLFEKSYRIEYKKGKVTHVSQKYFDTWGSVYYKIMVSKKHGIIRVKKEENCYAVTYELDGLPNYQLICRDE